MHNHFRWKLKASLKNKCVLGTYKEHAKENKRAEIKNCQVFVATGA